MTDTLGCRVEGDMYGASSTDGWYTFIHPFQGRANNGISYTGGLAPYNWSFSASSTVLTSAYGSINAATGSRINFTATASGEVDLLCTDSDATPTTVKIHVRIVPTSAPLWSELE